MGNTRKSFLFLVDDGWRYEKLELLLYLRDRLNIDVVTQDPLTEESLKKRMPVTRIPVFPLRRRLRYCLSYLFARELNTDLCKVVRRLRAQTYSPLLRFLAAFRELMGKIGLRRYEWIDALERQYQNSDRYDDLLSRYDALVFSPVSTRDKRIIFEAMARGMETICWVFSWDNPFKDTEFIRKADRYLVWNKENMQDLERWHGIPSSRCTIVGPAQLDYLHTPRPPRPDPVRPYILFACTMGPDYYVQQEIEIIRLIREKMNQLCPQAELHVRPYPFGGARAIATELSECEGVEVLPFGHNGASERVLISEQDLDDKFVQMQDALAMITLGSTIALEAALTDTPVLQVIFSLPNDLPSLYNLSEAWKNDHLKYVLDFDLPNIIRDPAALENALSLVASNDREALSPYSQHLRCLVDPLGVDNYKEVFYSALDTDI